MLPFSIKPLIRKDIREPVIACGARKRYKPDSIGRMVIDTSRARIAALSADASALRSVPASVFQPRLDRLRSLDPAALSEQQTFDHLSRAMHGYMIRSVIIGTSGVYRARALAKDALFEDASDLWYPPAAVIKHRGRFNGVGESRFYCSSELHAAIYEMRPRVGDRIVVLVAGAREPSTRIELAHVGIHKAIVEQSIVGRMGTGLRGDESFVAHLKAAGVLSRWLALDDYLTEIATSLYPATEESDRHKMTLSAARYLLRPKHYGGILYPTVAAGFQAFNLCLSPETADRVYFPSEAWLVEVFDHMPDLHALSADDATLPISFLRRTTDISAAGKLSWGERLSGIDPAEVGQCIARARQRADAPVWSRPTGSR